MVTRLLIADELGRVMYTANWCHPDRLEPFILANLVDGGVAYAVTVRTRAHFVDYEVPPAQRVDVHNSQLRQARDVDVQAFVGAAHRIVIDYTIGANRERHAHAAYAVRTDPNGVPSFASQAAMPDEVIDGAPRPLFRRVGSAFQRWHRGAWTAHDNDHTRHVRAMAHEGA